MLHILRKRVKNQRKEDFIIRRIQGIVQIHKEVHPETSKPLSLHFMKSVSKCWLETVIHLNFLIGYIRTIWFQHNQLFISCGKSVIFKSRGTPGERSALLYDYLNTVSKVWLGTVIIFNQQYAYCNDVYHDHNYLKSRHVHNTSFSQFSLWIER